MLLGYTRWENFAKVIEKAIIVCRASEHEPLDHFRDLTKMVDVGSGAKREVRGIGQENKIQDMERALPFRSRVVKG